MTTGTARPTFAFLGRWRLGAAALAVLPEFGDVAAVWTSPPSTEDLFAGLVWEEGRRLDAQLFDCMQRDWRSHFAHARVDLIISCAFPRILRVDELARARIGSINLHQSLLPRHRGRNPIPAAILADDEEVGITVHWMDIEADHGPILGQRRWSLCDTDTVQSIVDRTIAEAAPLLRECIPLALRGAPGVIQDHTKATLAPRRALPWDVPIGELRQKTHR